MKTRWDPHIIFYPEIVLRFDLTFAHCHKSRTIYRNFTVDHLQMSYRGRFQLVWNPGQTSQSIASQKRTNLLAIIKSKMTTWNTISPRCWLVAMWWHHFATFDDIILQHLMTSFWMTCTFWILNKQVKNSFLKLCTIFHRSSLDLDLDVV